MRLATLCILLAGCAGAPASEPITLTMGESLVPVLDPLRLTGEILVDQALLEDAGVCSTECQTLEFSLDSNQTLTATLIWENPANDLDLYLYQGNAFIAMDRGTAPGNEHTIVMDLPAGDYELRVVPFASTYEHWQLQATFDA